MNKKPIIFIFPCLKYLILLICIFTATGCSVYKNLYRYDGPAFEKILNIPEGKGLVYIYRPPKLAAGAAVFDIYSGTVIPYDAINSEWLAGKELTILYEMGWATYSKLFKRHYCPETGERSKVDRLMGERTALEEDHDILIASRNGLPILSDEAVAVKIDRSGCYFPYIVDAGEVNFRTDECLHQDLRINVESGQVYYLKIALKFGGEITMSMAPKEVAEFEILECKLLTSDDYN